MAKKTDGTRHIDGDKYHSGRYFACLYLLLNDLRGGMSVADAFKRYSVTFLGYVDGLIRIGLELPEGVKSDEYVNSLEVELGKK